MTDAAAALAALRDRIDTAGSLSIADYMAFCLSDPVHGYYRVQDPLGRSGDFTTAPEISQIFGEMAGLALVQAWRDQGAPGEVVLVELGPGRGRLMADALRAARAAPAFLEAARLWLVETSAPLRAAQARNLAASGVSPRWVDRFEQTPEGPLFLIANEFFDALPIRQHRRASDGWRERRVALVDGALAYVDGAAAAAAPAPEAADAPIGAWIEICAQGRDIAAAVGARLAAHGGAAVIVDYGYDASLRSQAGWKETFQAVRAHAYADPLAAPGAADLTAHVDFSALAAAAQAAGAAAAGPLPQGKWLRRLGAETRAAALARARPDQAEAIAAGIGRLTDPREMGVVFKALALTPLNAPAAAGFEGAEGTAR